MNNQKTIDLHGFNESQAVTKIIMALYELDSDETIDSLKFIVGKGQVLSSILVDHLYKENYHWDYDGHNSGAMIVFKKNSYF